MNVFPECEMFLEFKSRGYILENHSISKEINLKSEDWSLQKLESIFKKMIVMIEMNHLEPTKFNIECNY